MREVYVLYQCGLFPPTMEEVGEVLATQMMLPVELRSAIPKFFSVPLQSVAVDATVPAAMMASQPANLVILCIAHSRFAFTKRRMSMS
jgi:hypothetical protein